MKILTFEDASSLYDTARARFETLAEEAVRTRGRFTVALSGGSTPCPLYERLAESDRVPWEAVHVFWSDERCVPPDDALSNSGSARASLLERVSVPQTQIHRIPGEDPPIEAAEAYEVLLRRELRPSGRLDLVLLGLGADGHTASLFPRHQALEETERLVLAVHVCAEPAWRVTMTLPLINAAREILFLVAGKEKAQILSQVERGEDLPASLVRPVNGRLTWMTAVGRASRGASGVDG